MLKNMAGNLAAKADINWEEKEKDEKWDCKNMAGFRKMLPKNQKM